MTYIYYRMDCKTEQELTTVSDYFIKRGHDVQADNMHIFVTSDESERIYNGMGDDGLYLESLLDDVKPLIETLGEDFVIEATVDTSELAGEYMDYRFTTVKGRLMVKRSDWYKETCMRSYVDYKDFCDKFCDCSEEEYERIKVNEFVNLVESETGEYLTGDVPLYEVKI